MIKLPILLVLAAFSLTCLSGCAAVGSLLKSVMQLPRSVLGTVTDAEGKPIAPSEPTADQPIDSQVGEAVSIVVTPVK
jgi:hypothetical protein